MTYALSFLDLLVVAAMSYKCFIRGPNWIHGTLADPILKLAKETRTALCSAEGSTCAYDERGDLIEKGKADSLFELVWSIISDAFQKSNESFSTIPSSTSLKDYFVERISPRDLSDGDKKLVYQLAETWGTFIGDPLEKQSLKFFWLEECLDGGIDHVMCDSVHIFVDDH